MATPHQPEQAPLNTEKEEREVGTLEIEVTRTISIEEKSAADEMKEKLKKPTIGASLVIFLIINSIQFFVGITTTKDCPAKEIIPIYLAVAGALGIVTKIIPIVNRNRRMQIVDKILYALFTIELIWMILGSYWIYSIYQPNYDPLVDRHDYCNKTAYLLAFWLLTLNYIFLALAIAIPCCILCCLCCVTACAATQ